VDWRGSIIARAGRSTRAGTPAVDWPALADAWRGRYQPALDEVRSAPPAVDDPRHAAPRVARRAAPSFGLDKLDEAARDHLTAFWHRLNPWPEHGGRAHALKRRFVIGPLSNGSFALLTNMAKHAGCRGREPLVRAVPRLQAEAETYLGAAACSDSAGGDDDVAAHYSDLQAARGCGLLRVRESPAEFGDKPKKRPAGRSKVDLVVTTSRAGDEARARGRERGRWSSALLRPAYRVLAHGALELGRHLDRLVPERA